MTLEEIIINRVKDWLEMYKATKAKVNFTLTKREGNSKWHNATLVISFKDAIYEHTFYDFDYDVLFGTKYIDPEKEVKEFIRILESTARQQYLEN